MNYEDIMDQFVKAQPPLDGQMRSGAHSIGVLAAGVYAGANEVGDDAAAVTMLFLAYMLAK